MLTIVLRWMAGAVLGAAVLAGCDRGAAPATRPASGGGVTGGAAVETAANGVASGHTFKTETGMDLAGVKNQEMLHPQFELGPDDVETEVIFGVVRNEEKHSSVPVVLKKFGEAWRVVEVAEASGQEWVHVAAGPADGEAWGFLDAGGEHGEAKGGQVMLMHTTDNGETWQYFSAVKKVCAAAYMVDFAMSEAGAGRLTLHVLENNDPVAQGYYHYKTKDGGKTWTGPTVEADETTEAESLKQFNTVREAIKDEAGEGAGKP